MTRVLNVFKKSVAQVIASLLLCTLELMVVFLNVLDVTGCAYETGSFCGGLVKF